MNSSGSVLESQLRQRIVLLEDSLARLASTRKELHDNVDVVKNEVRLSFSHQLSRLRHREQQILEKLDTVASVKDGILSQQQDQMHQALGACSQGLEWLQTAFEDVKTNRLTSIVTVEQRISDILNKLSSMEIMPRETAHISYEADPVALRRAISSFGQVRSTSAPRHCESLPCGLEDYEDEECAHMLLHKTVHGSTRPITTVTFGRPKLSTDHNDWLLKEALTSQPTKDTQQNYEPSCESRCIAQNKRQDQVHNWLHQIKNLVENEPAVFDDFETIKKRLSVGNQCENLDIVSFDVLFRPYFEMVLNSPAQQWLFGKTSDHLSTKETIFENIHSSTMENGEDLESCNSSFTFNSDTSFIRPSEATVNSGGEKSFVDEYSEFWKQFLKKLWSTSDSMWLLPCASNQPQTVVVGDDDVSFGLDCEYVMAIDDCLTEKKKECLEKFIGSTANDGGRDKSYKASDWLMNDDPPKNVANQQRFGGGTGGGSTNGDRLSNVFNKISMSDFPTKTDCQQWLFRPEITNSIEEPSNCQPQEIHIYEDAVGWKSVLEKVHGLGDEKWLYKQPSSNCSHKNTNFQMAQCGYPPSSAAGF